jgi:hypothetical protein
MGDSWAAMHAEGKKPIKITESSLKGIIKEAVLNILNDIKL